MNWAFWLNKKEPMSGKPLKCDFCDGFWHNEAVCRKKKPKQTWVPKKPVTTAPKVTDITATTSQVVVAPVEGRKSPEVGGTGENAWPWHTHCSEEWEGKGSGGRGVTGSTRSP